MQGSHGNLGCRHLPGAVSISNNTHKNTCQQLGLQQYEQSQPERTLFLFWGLTILPRVRKDFGSFDSAGSALPSIYFSKPRPFWISIISYDVIINTFWISRNNLCHLSSMHYDLKTVRRPRRKQLFHLGSLGQCLRTQFSSLGYWTENKTKRFSKNLSGPELPYTAVGHMVRKASKTREYYFKQN